MKQPTISNSLYIFIKRFNRLYNIKTELFLRSAQTKVNEEHRAEKGVWTHWNVNMCTAESELNVARNFAWRSQGLSFAKVLSLDFYNSYT